MTTKSNTEYGISALGLAIPSLALPLSDLGNYNESLGCEYMALCNTEENVTTLACKAARRAISDWDGELEDIGMVVVGTETAVDMSRPLSAWVMQDLGLSGNIRSYEVKHACYGGTAAVRQAIEWHLSGNSRGKAALVVCADVATYAPGHSGEPSQGAGAVAMIIDKPTIAAISPESYYWSDPQFDFWRPVGNKFPEVNGRLTLVCYIKGVLECFKQLAPEENLGAYLQEYSLLNFHVPFPKMVQKAVKKLGALCKWDAEYTQSWFEEKILSTMKWNQIIGNSYTGSLWFSVANSLTKLNSNELFAAFSYGSGCGAELLTLQCKTNQAKANWVRDLEQDLAERTIIDLEQYQQIRDKL